MTHTVDSPGVTHSAMHLGHRLALAKLPGQPAASDHQSINQSIKYTVWRREPDVTRQIHWLKSTGEHHKLGSPACYMKLKLLQQ